MGAPAIVVEHLVKRFRIAKQPTHMLKEAVIGLLHGRREYHSFVALEDVSFSVGAGESLGIIGPNGSGKSTLFRLLSGILKPSSGRAMVRGRISPLIELSAGFHPDLTGIENVYLNGSVYGLSRSLVDRKLDGILAFAGIGDFVYSPVRIYSSGMLARLAFAVAVNVDADVLLIDEVLSVGDAEFQEQCLARIRELRRAGVTIVYVSHDLDSVARICDRVICLEHGRIIDDGRPATAIAAYKDRMLSRRASVGA